MTSVNDAILKMREYVLIHIHLPFLGPWDTVYIMFQFSWRGIGDKCFLPTPDDSFQVNVELLTIASP